MRIPVLALASLFLGLQQPSLVLAQGSLTPPGAPAPMMKTLDQIDAKLEKRTPISTAPFTIGTSGSYYLTGNLAMGTAGGTAITINADEVTLDLNGFTISSNANPAAGTGVLINGILQNVTVRNGNIRGATTFSGGAFSTGGFLRGVLQGSATSANIRIADLNIRGMGGDGINLGISTTPTLVVERCNVTTCAGQGIFAGMVRDCAAKTTGDDAIDADIVTNCSGETVNTARAGASGVVGVGSVENSRGISVSGAGLFGNNASNSRGESTSGVGLSATNATNCYGGSSTGTGLNAANNATNCYGNSSSGTGLSASTATNCFGFSSSGPAGLDANPGTASFCRGQRPGGIAIDAGIAIGCTVAAGTVSSINKFLGTP